MSSDQYAISVRGLGKSYQIGKKQTPSTAAEALLAWARNPVRPAGTEEMWALRDVSFDIPRGSVVGLLGRNGAGKSTLLKLLSRITAPTTGEIRVAGRVASLIEVGTGFQPELTGRENIYLNGAILGMRRKVITQRFDEIVEFSGVERFLDTPVKHYSSGMYVRLAFAVAAHLDADILLVDEVLSVGDTEFQKKSLGKMEAVAHEGRTVLFVSHDMAALEALCDTGIIFGGGRLMSEAPIREALATYHQKVVRNAAPTGLAPYELGAEFKHLRSFDVVDASGNSIRTLAMADPLQVRIVVEVDEPFDYPAFIVKINNTKGQRMLTLRSPRSDSAIPRLVGRSEITCNVGQLPLAPGEYGMSITLSRGVDEVEDVEPEIYFTVRNADAFRDGWGFREGVAVAPSDWSLVPLENEAQARRRA